MKVSLKVFSVPSYLAVEIVSFVEEKICSQLANCGPQIKNQYVNVDIKNNTPKFMLI
jgi:hypothetical protein